MNAPPPEHQKSKEQHSGFEHQKLQHHDEIRLIQLLPARRGSVVRFRLVHSRLDQPSRPPYTAISYVWGSQDHLTPVECVDDGGSIWVTQNCQAVLAELRHSFAEGLFWIDAISIDQSRTTERNHQVLLMKRIYSNAARVLTYLGDGPLRITALLHRMRRPIKQTQTSNRLPREPNCYPSGNSTQLRKAWSIDDSECMIIFLRHPYWRRMWVVQEICSATRLEIMYNGEVYDEALVRTIVSIRGTVMGTPLWFPLPLTALIRDPTSRWQWDLWTLLTFTRTFSTSDMRDRVIALLGIAEQTDELLKELLADYDTDTDRLFQRLIVYFFLQVVGIQPCQVFKDVSALGCGLDVSSLQVSSTDQPELEHVLRLPNLGGATSQTQDGSTHTGHPPGTVYSDVYSVLQLMSLWRRSHEFFDTSLPFEDVESFGHVLRNRSSQSNAGQLDTHDVVLPDVETIPMKLAITPDGQLHCVCMHVSAGLGSAPPIELILGSVWKVRCSDPLHYSRTHKTCCSRREDPQIGLGWVSTAPKQIGQSRIWRDNEIALAHGGLRRYWPEAQGKDPGRDARKRSFTDLVEDFE